MHGHTSPCLRHFSYRSELKYCRFAIYTRFDCFSHTKKKISLVWPSIILTVLLAKGCLRCRFWRDEISWLFYSFLDWWFSLLIFPITPLFYAFTGFIIIILPAASARFWLRCHFVRCSLLPQRLRRYSTASGRKSFAAFWLFRRPISRDFFSSPEERPPGQPGAPSWMPVRYRPSLLDMISASMILASYLTQLLSTALSLSSP